MVSRSALYVERLGLLDALAALPPGKRDVCRRNPYQLPPPGLAPYRLPAGGHARIGFGEAPTAAGAGPSSFPESQPVV